MSNNVSLSIEECPLQNHRNCKKRPSTLKGPVRVIKLCVLGIILPTALVALPLYMRYHVYGNQLYPLAMSDMRLLDNKVSTTWCQRQSVRVNATFNAFLLPEPPKILLDLKPMSMVRHLVLEDDTKEYWGFYLLQGSSVTVSTCTRWPGASLIVLKGHKHLHECAYIGDNSSEELDEMMEALQEKSYKPPESPANKPSLMTRHRAEVEIPYRNVSKNNTINKVIDASDITDPKILKAILDALQEKKKQIKKNDFSKASPRNSTIAKEEANNIRIEAPKFKQTQSQEVYSDILKKLQSLGEKSASVLEKLNRKFNTTHQEQELNLKGRQYRKPLVNFDDNIDNGRRRRDIEIEQNLNQDDEENDFGREDGFSPKPDGIADHRGTVNETTLNDRSNSEFWSSFSSSEEALLNCAGLILNLALTPHHKCNPNLTEDEADETYLANTITYKVPVNGYYFFIFNSENEVQANYIRVHFHLKKSTYNVSNSVATCKNSTKACDVDLKFFSSEKLVMELPVTDNDSLWNEEFIVVSECEPRTAIYAVCILAVPIFVMLFAFS